MISLVWSCTDDVVIVDHGHEAVKIGSRHASQILYREGLELRAAHIAGWGDLRLIVRKHKSLSV